MELLAKMKSALRISAASTAFDGEIQDLIDAAAADLELAGIDPAQFVPDDPDPLIKRAVTTFVKANFGFDNPDADRLQASYESIKAHLSLSADYTPPAGA